MLIHYRMLLLILVRASPIIIHALPILKHWLGFRVSAPYLNTCFAYLNTLSRISAPYHNTCIAYLNTLSRLHILIHWTDMTRLGNTRDSQSETSITSPERFWLGVKTVLGCGLAIAYLNTWWSSPPAPPPPTSSAHTITTLTNCGGIMLKAE